MHSAMSMSETNSLHLYSLPNEVFVQILDPFPTRSLLTLTTVSQRFYALVLRLLHYRLLDSASLQDLNLILECYHPTSKLTEPHVFCKYLGTDGLSHDYDVLYENVDTSRKLAQLSSLYSRFRPEAAVEEHSNNNEARMTPSFDISNHEDTVVKRVVNLDEFENFSQLCVHANLVKVIPGTSLLLSAVNIEEGVIRLFRHWLRNQAESYKDHHNHQEQILWVDRNQNVGLKMRVQEVTEFNQSFPILVHRDEDAFRKYAVYIDELHIRTTRVLLTLEQSLLEQANYSKAVIFTRAVG